MRRTPPRRSRVEPIGPLVADTLRRLGRAQELLEPRAIVAWADVAGPRVAARTRAERLKDGVLTVRVDGAAWLNELTYLKADLLARLNEHLGGGVVRDIRFLPGTVPQAPARPAPAAPEEEPPPLDPMVAARIRAEAEAIADPALREAIVALRLKVARRPPGRRER
ncbi:MAG: DUF721 domain-containing protein [Deltaproteobacteria bacterium]|nr:DUF721 domain-containing protein [Deltaproteobacteria bacterium]